jgi:hypothetical protein
MTKKLAQSLVIAVTAMVALTGCGGVDATQSPAYQSLAADRDALQQQLDAAQQQLDAANKRADAAESAAASATPSEPGETPTQTTSEAATAGNPDAPIDGDIFGPEVAVTYAGMTLTVHSAEVVDRIKAVSGADFVPADGEELVLIKTTFVNRSTKTVDLSCSGPGRAYIQVWDSEGREMPNVFNTYRIPGNQKCNAQLMTGQESAYNFAVRGIAGATPYGMTIIDTDTFGEGIQINFSE